MFGISPLLIRKYRIPILLSVLSVLLLLSSYFAADYFYKSVQLKRGEISVSEEENLAFTKRLNLLRTVEAQIAENSDIVVDALPQYNPAPLILAQLNSQAVRYNLSISNMNLNASGQSTAGASEWQTVRISFELAGSYTGVSSYISQLANLSPIVNLDGIDIQEAGDRLEANVDLLAYFAPQPSELPVVSNQDDFTDDEKSVLNVLEDLERFSFSTGDTTNVPRGKDDPFSSPVDIESTEE